MGRVPRRQDPSKKRLDIRDVARHANVSIATVSRTINGVTSVDKVLAQRVWKTIDRLKYFPNTQARALVSGRSKLFGLLVSDITNPFFPELIQGFENVAMQNGYDIMISSTYYDPMRMQMCIRRLLERGVEGVAVMTFGIELPLLKELSSRNIPLVFIDQVPAELQGRIVSMDYRHGIRQGVQHLAALGHRNITFVAGPPGQHSSELRKEAFVSSIAEIGIKFHPALVVEGDHTLEGGMRAAEHLLKEKPFPTAIMCSNDMTAIGLMRAFSRRQPAIAVPEQVSVIGFDDIHLSEFVYPPLTSVHMSRIDIARAAFEILQEEAENRNAAGREQNIIVTTNLTVRQSTSFPLGSMDGLRGNPATGA